MIDMARSNIKSRIAGKKREMQIGTAFLNLVNRKNLCYTEIRNVNGGTVL